TIVSQVHDSVFRVHILGRKRKAYTNLNADKIKPRLNEEEGMDHPGDPVSDDADDDVPLRQRFPRQTRQRAPPPPQFTRSRQPKSKPTLQTHIADLAAILVMVQEQFESPIARAFTMDMLWKLVQEGKTFAWWTSNPDQQPDEEQLAAGGQQEEHEPPPVPEDEPPAPPPPAPPPPPKHPPEKRSPTTTAATTCSSTAIPAGAKFKPTSSSPAAARPARTTGPPWRPSCCTFTLSAPPPPPPPPPPPSTLP
ncbi:unnamed protein product, partial [Sphagnum tenellum]